MTYGSFKATIDIFDTQEISKQFPFAEEIKVGISGSKSAERLCELMFNDNVVTSRRSTIMQLAVETFLTVSLDQTCTLNSERK